MHSVLSQSTWAATSCIPGAGRVIQINDRKLLSTLRVKLKYSDQQDMQT